MEKLEQLARRQSDVLASKLGEGSPPDLPTREMPYGSEGVVSPTYIAQEPVGEAPPDSTPRIAIEEPSYHGPSAQFEKGETFPLKETPLPPNDEEKDVLET